MKIGYLLNKGWAVNPKTVSWKCSNCDSPCVVTATFNGVKPFPPCMCPYWLKNATWKRVRIKKEGP